MLITIHTRHHTTRIKTTTNSSVFALPYFDRNSNAFKIYTPRFVCYLSRFLLTYDDPSRLWWFENPPPPSSPLDSDSKFSEFSESVSVGLCDYFLGPYGSYSSVDVAIAGLNAKQQVASSISSKDLKGIKQGVLNLLSLLQVRN